MRHQLQAHDGWRLDVVELPPAVGPARATVVVGHAMMVDRRTIWRDGRACLAATLAAAGLRVLVPDLRGHGASGPRADEGGDWSYQDLIDDVGLYLQLARRLDPAVPVVLVGHSLFAHVSLAYLGQTGAAPADAWVGLAANVWGRRWEPSLLRWWTKRSVITGVDAVCRVFGRVPARRFGYGSADEARSYWRDLSGWVRGGVWGRAGGIDYHAGLSQVTCPALLVVSDGDRWLAHPDDALRFTAALPRRDVLRVGAGAEDPALQSLLLDHIPLVTHPRAEPVWRAVGEWIVRAVG